MSDLPLNDPMVAINYDKVNGLVLTIDSNQYVSGTIHDFKIKANTSANQPVYKTVKIQEVSDCQAHKRISNGICKGSQSQENTGNF